MISKVIRKNIGGKFAEKGLELQYNALRDEILKRIELRQQLIAITLTIAGALLAVGINNDLVALIYPPLAMFLALGWSQNDLRIRFISRYIREKIEPLVPGLGFEGYTHSANKERRGLESQGFTVLSHSGTFILTQAMALGLGIFNLKFSALKLCFIGIDVIAILVVVWIAIQSSKLRARG